MRALRENEDATKINFLTDHDTAFRVVMEMESGIGDHWWEQDKVRYKQFGELETWHAALDRLKEGNFKGMYLYGSGGAHRYRLDKQGGVWFYADKVSHKRYLEKAIKLGFGIIY